VESQTRVGAAMALLIFPKMIDDDDASMPLLGGFSTVPIALCSPSQTPLACPDILLWSGGRGTNLETSCPSVNVSDKLQRRPPPVLASSRSPSEARAQTCLVFIR
jgi:hypothetical protein